MRGIKMGEGYYSPTPILLQVFCEIVVITTISGNLFAQLSSLVIPQNNLLVQLALPALENVPLSHNIELRLDQARTALTPPPGSAAFLLAVFGGEPGTRFFRLGS